MQKRSILLLISLFVYLIFVSPILFEWNDIVQACGVLIIAQILWVGGVFPFPFSALIIMLIVSFHFFRFEETLGFLGSDVVWLLFSTYIISGAFLESGLAYRISLYALRLSKGSGKLLLFVLMLLILILSVFIPSNIGRGNLIVSVLNNIATHFTKMGKAKNISKALFIAGSHVVTIGGAAVVTGANSTIYAFSMFNDTSTSEISYLMWMLLFTPPMIIFIVVLWLVLLLIFPLESVNSREIMNYIEGKIVQIGSVKRSELKMIILISFIVLLWILQPYHGYSISMIAMLGAVLTMLPLIGIWEWKQAKDNVNWGMLLFFASTLIVSHLLIRTETLDFFAKAFIEYVPFNNSFMILFILVVLTVLLRSLFVSILGYMTLMIPFAIVIGKHVDGIPSLTIAMAVFLAGVPAFFFVTQSPVHIIFYSYGYFTKKDLFYSGSIVVFIWIVIVLSTVYFYWSYLL
ncbi:anion permease [Virgibacillus necropolis]|uniref:SLC13 family permease n=1 Tax=Virgibacillus necropolis TaxID=163877 RepID=UPI0038513966